LGGVVASPLAGIGPLVRWLAAVTKRRGAKGLLGWKHLSARMRVPLLPSFAALAVLATAAPREAPFSFAPEKPNARL
jgi:hypothetical protein